MADSILKIRTQDGDKPIGYPGLADKPVANKELDTEGAFADAKVVGDKFKEVKAETDSLKEDLEDTQLSEDITDKISYVEGYYINSKGNSVPEDTYHYSYPINLEKGDSVKLEGFGYQDNVCMIAEEIGSTSFGVLVKSANGITNYSYTADTDIPIRVCMRNDKVQKVTIIHSAKEMISKSVKYDDEIKEINWNDGYVNANGNLVSGDSGFIFSFSPISLKRGETITVHGKGYSTNVAIIAEYTSSWTALPVFVKSTNSEIKDYYYTAVSDVQIVISINKNAEHSVSIQTNVLKKVKNISDKIDDVNEEIKKITESIGTDYMFMLHNIGIVGDSLSSGEIAYADDSGEHYIDCYNYSWLSNICKVTGATSKHYSEGGMTTKKWISSNYKTKLEADDPQNAYYIALGTNDRKQNYPLGSASDASGTDSFVGYYKQIIDIVRSHAPNACIFLVSLYSDTNETYTTYSNMISQIADLYANCWYVDFIGNTTIRTTDGSTNYTNYGHFLTAGYIVVADTIHKLTNKILEENLGKNFIKLFAVNN